MNEFSWSIKAIMGTEQRKLQPQPDTGFGGAEGLMGEVFLKGLNLQ